MARHSGSARDPFSSEPSKTSNTPGMGWVIIGFVVICVAVAAANLSGASLPFNGTAHVAGPANSQG